jgi:hypothetical protein
MSVLLFCQCEGKDPSCSKCNGHEKLEISQSYWISRDFDFGSLSFLPVGGLFQVFYSGKELIGAGNIEYQTETRSYYIYDLHSFWGKEGHEIMTETMIATHDIDFIEGRFEWEGCLV